MLFLALGVAHANSNLSIAITVGQWLLKNQTRSFYIQVEAQGVNDNEARHNGFVLAVDQAVGTLILSERESDKKQLIKNDVYNYSSGYVTDYKILSKSTRGNNSVLVMDVWVSNLKFISISKKFKIVYCNAKRFIRQLDQYQNGV